MSLDMLLGYTTVSLVLYWATFLHCTISTAVFHWLWGMLQYETSRVQFTVNCVSIHFLSCLSGLVVCGHDAIIQLKRHCFISVCLWELKATDSWWFRSNGFFYLLGYCNNWNNNIIIIVVITIIDSLDYQI